MCITEVAGAALSLFDCELLHTAVSIAHVAGAPMAHRHNKKIETKMFRKKYFSQKLEINFDKSL
jgi:hypothetical protein